MRTKTENSAKLNSPHTTPPAEYYEVLAKFKIFPKKTEEQKSLDQSKNKRQRPQYRIEKQRGKCSSCNNEIALVVIYQDRPFCLDCANREIYLAK
jgi:hypothetical protein